MHNLEINNNKELGVLVKKYREEFEYSQERLAERMSIPRSAISLIESGKREVSSSELALFAKEFDLSIEELLYKNKCDKEVNLRDKNEKPIFNKEKFKQILLYIIEKCGSKINVGKTVIYKLLYFIDFDYYELNEEYLTGELYRKIEHGPAPCHYEEIEKELLENKKIFKTNVDYHNYKQIKYIPLLKADISLLTANDKEIIDNVIERLSSMNAHQIEDYSHEDIPYEITPDLEIIDYETVFYRKEMHSVREY
jgi:transcriptional regulator with XRE-family HTH domain